MAKAAKAKKKGKREWDEGLSALNRNVAGIDVGNADHYVAVPIGRDPEPVRTYGSFTSDLHCMAQWLKACGIETVVMQATGAFIGSPFSRSWRARDFRSTIYFVRPGNPSVANLSSTTGKSGDCSEHMHPAHAENAHADERPVGQCNQRY